MDKPSYYAIIPAEVRYSEINPSAKLLYGEITALCNQKGYCWASNGYFSELYGVTKNTISTWVSVLKKHGFVSVEIIRNEHKQVVKRKIGIMENRDTPIIEILKSNSKEINTKKESITLRIEMFRNNVIIENNDIKLSESDVENFIDYWTEPNISGTKMRYELERTYDISRRMLRWQKNNLEWQKTTNSTKTTKVSSKVRNAHEEWLKAQEMINNEPI
jgi:hypothetical protein